MTAPTNSGSGDAFADTTARLLAAVLAAALVLIALPLLIPLAVRRIAGEGVATRTRFWIVWKWQWAVNTAGILLVAGLLSVEVVLATGWIRSGDAGRFLDSDNWGAQLLPALLPWVVANLLSGILLLPALWSIQRRRFASLVRNRRVSDVIRQERIEAARKRAADHTAALTIGVKVDARTGHITATRPASLIVPHPVGDGRQAFGLVNRTTVRMLADRFHDIRRVRDWIDPAGTHAVLPETASAVRALVIAESGSGKTVLLNGLILCALKCGWPVFALDAKGDPGDADTLAHAVRAQGGTAAVGEPWNLFAGTAEQVTSKLMRLMPVPDGANQYYLDEIRGVLQAVQHHTPISGIDDLRDRLTDPRDHVRDQFDLTMVNQSVDRSGTTAGRRALQSLLVALRPLEQHLDQDGWSFDHPRADVTIVPLATSDDAQTTIGDLLLLDLRHFLTTRMGRRDKTPVLVLVDEFAQLVTGGQDPGDTAGSLFETARSAGVGLILSAQSPAGLSNDDTRRRRALTSGAALIFGRSKDPEDVVGYAGSVMRMEANARIGGNELGSGRAQHTFVIPPQDVREAADGAFWIVQAGAIAPFRALPHQHSAQEDPASTDEGASVDETSAAADDIQTQDARSPFLAHDGRLDPPGPSLCGSQPAGVAHEAHDQ
jgi:hypothetical protein